MGRLSLWVLLALTMFALSLQDVQVSADVGPSESECRPYIEKAINELKTGDTTESAEAGEGSQDGESAEDTGGDVGSKEETADGESAEQDADDTGEEGVVETVETVEDSDEETTEKTEEPADHSEEEGEQADADKSEDDGDQSEAQSQEEAETDDQKSEETADADKSEEDTAEKLEDDDKSGEKEENAASEEGDDEKSAEEDEQQKEEVSGATAEGDSGEEEDENGKTAEESAEEKADDEQSEEVKTADGGANSEEEKDGDDDDTHEEQSAEQKDDETDNTEEENDEEEIKSRGKRSLEEDDDEEAEGSKEDETKEKDSGEDQPGESEDEEKEEADDDDDSKEGETKQDEKADDDSKEGTEADDESKEGVEADGKADDDDDEESGETEDEEESQPEDDLLLEVEIPENLRDRKHIDELLHLDDEFEEKEKASDRVAEIILRDLKRIYETAVKPLETLYKYRDLSNRHFSDPEIFSKPLILFMGPWSGGKSTIINYLTGNEYTPNSLRTGAEPSPAYFNIVMYGNETEVLDGTQMAADWTFSGLQKFGQGLEDRLRGLKLPDKLLEKVNIVEIPGILEVRKQVSRLFPFNDACQWFIDRADIIFLVYDPAKLDVGPETEAILDQLKGREYQTRIILNKADTVKPEELLRVQGALIWNISPLMSSAQPPIMYTTSLWSHPYETSAPVRLLQAQERAFLRDIRSAIDKRIENKIASARRFAVRVRNHAKMVDCYLTTYYNHKTLFGNKKRIADQIIDNPQNYHIYEGLSTLTNISRYDLPDPEVYRDFFRLNPLFEFKKLSETCTYFRGCPINKLDVAIAYDLPELVGKYKKMSESALASLESTDQGKS